jgi:hypothetical protein
MGLRSVASSLAGLSEKADVRGGVSSRFQIRVCISRCYRCSRPTGDFTLNSCPANSSLRVTQPIAPPASVDLKQMLTLAASKELSLQSSNKRGGS